MHFTREPIIQTVITPKDGCKLVIRSSKGKGQEDYIVDAVEVVSFGEALFFRSTEKPKSFLVPVSDYEVLELKETRVVLKNVGIEKSIKIGGGKDASKSKDNSSDEKESQPEKKKERRRSRRKKTGSAEKKDVASEAIEEAPASADKEKQPQEAKPKSTEKGTTNKEKSAEADEKVSKSESESKAKEEASVSTSFLSKLFPPPPGLIKEKYQKENANEAQKADDPKVVEKQKKEIEPELTPQDTIPSKENDSSSDS